MREPSGLALVALALACGGAPTPPPEPPPRPVAEPAEPVYPPLGELPLPALPPAPDDPAPALRDHVTLLAETSCAVVGGRVRCWGSNRFGQLGAPALEVGRSARRESAAAVAGLSDVRQLAGGTWHLCAVTGERALRCWGHNGWGQLGDGSTEDRQAPVAAALEDVVQVTAGEGHTCARRADRTLWCWGRNDLGQLGDGSREERHAPVQVPLEDVREVAAGRAHTCARVGDEGQVHCWGENVDAALGDGGRSAPAGYRAEPGAVLRAEDDDAPVSAGGLALGGSSSCAIAGGGVLCWGRNDSYQLGARPGGRPESVLLRPTPMAGASDVSEVAVGGRHSCVVARSSEEGVTRVHCTGLNHRGQLGDGSRTHRRELTEVSALSDAQDVDVGEAHACALRPASVVCWGDNRRGQLGDGSRTRRTEPVPVRGSDAWFAPAPTPASE